MNYPIDPADCAGLWGIFFVGVYDIMSTEVRIISSAEVRIVPKADMEPHRCSHGIMSEDIVSMDIRLIERR